MFLLEIKSYFVELPRCYRNVLTAPASGVGAENTQVFTLRFADGAEAEARAAYAAAVKIRRPGEDVSLTRIEVLGSEG
jgi:hypothetical protein